MEDERGKIDLWTEGETIPPSKGGGGFLIWSFRRIMLLFPQTDLDWNFHLVWESWEKTEVLLSDLHPGRLCHPSLFSTYSAGWVQGSMLQSRLKIWSDSLLWTRVTQHYNLSYRTLMQLDTHLVETLIFRTSPNILMKPYCHLPQDIPPTLPQLHFQALVGRKH